MSSIPRISKDVITADLAGETVLLDTKCGVYYGLADVGHQIWELVQQSKSVQEIHDEVLATFDVDSERCERDVINLLSEMTDRDLIEID